MEGVHEMLLEEWAVVFDSLEANEQVAIDIENFQPFAVVIIANFQIANFIYSKFTQNNQIIKTSEGSRKKLEWPQGRDSIEKNNVFFSSFGSHALCQARPSRCLLM